MDNIIDKEPIYSNRDMVKLENSFGIGIDDLVIRHYAEIAKIDDAINLFDIYNEERKELEAFLIDGVAPKFVSAEFILLCLKFNPQFYSFAQMVIEDAKKKKLKRNISGVKDIISKIFKQKTK